MYKVLIVEDEMLVRLGIKASTNWNRFNMKVIADVENGQQAWDTYEKERPDVIITDIRMPVMDGLQLIARIREKDQDTQIIILSCLEEFSLVQKAMKLGVMDYILKLAMSQEEMEILLSKIEKRLDDKQIGLNRAEKPAPETEPEQRTQKLLYDFFINNLYNEASFGAAMSRAGLRLTPENLVLCMLEIDNFNKAKGRFKDERGDLIRFSVTNIINEVLDSQQTGVSFTDAPNRYIIIFNAPNTKTAEDKAAAYTLLSNIFEQFRRALDTYLDFSITILVSPLHNGYDNLKRMFKKCMDAQEYKFFLGTGQTIYLDKTGRETVHKAAVQQLEALSGRGKEFIALIREDVLKLASSPEFTKYNTLNSLLSWYIHILRSLDAISPDPHYTNVIELDNMLKASETLEEGIRIFESCLGDIVNFTLNMRHYSKEIIQAIQIITRQYDKKISVEQIADAIKYSPNYLCTVFKKETGVSLTEYINNVRIKNSKKLLLEGNLKIYEIADKVGFMNESYFARIFKKLTGMSPNEYKGANNGINGLTDVED